MAMQHVTLKDPNKPATVETRGTSKQGNHDTPDNMIGRVILELQDVSKDFDAEVEALTESELGEVIENLTRGNSAKVGRFTLTAHAA